MSALDKPILGVVEQLCRIVVSIDDDVCKPRVHRRSSQVLVDGELAVDIAYNVVLVTKLVDHRERLFNKSAALDGERFLGRAIHLSISEESSVDSGCTPGASISPALHLRIVLIPNKHRSILDESGTLEIGQSACAYWYQFQLRCFE